MSDTDTDSDTEVVEFLVEDASTHVVDHRGLQRVGTLTTRARQYASRLRTDRRLFVEALRSGRVRHVGAVES